MHTRHAQRERKDWRLEKTDVTHVFPGLNLTIRRHRVPGVVELKSPGGNEFLVVIGVHDERNTKLPVVAETTDGLRFAFGAG